MAGAGTDMQEDWTPPFRVTSFPDEPIPALLVRFSHVHGWLSLFHFCKTLGSTPAKINSGADLAILAKMTRIPLSDLADRLPVSRGGSVTYFGHQLSTEWLAKNHRRVCPTCMASGGHHRFWWDLNFIDRCPDHGIELTSRCGCGAVLTYGDADNLMCADCTRVGGTDGMAAVQVPARPFQAWFLAQIACGPSADQVPVLDELPLAVAVQLVLSLGALTTGGYSKTKPALSARQDEATASAEAAFAVLSTNDMTPLLRDVVSGFTASRRSVFSVTPIETLGWFTQEYGYRFAGKTPTFTNGLKAGLSEVLGFDVIELGRQDFVSLHNLANELKAPREAIAMDMPLRI